MKRANGLRTAVVLVSKNAKNTHTHKTHQHGLRMDVVWYDTRAAAHPRPPRLPLRIVDSNRTTARGESAIERKVGRT